VPGGEFSGVGVDHGTLGLVPGVGGDRSFCGAGCCLQVPEVDVDEIRVEGVPVCSAADHVTVE
jgi:hypothetical protein